MRVEGRLEVIFEIGGASWLDSLFRHFTVAARHVVVVWTGEEVPPTGQEVPPANAPVTCVAAARGAFGIAPAEAESPLRGSLAASSDGCRLGRRYGTSPEALGPAGICSGRGRAWVMPLSRTGGQHLQASDLAA